MATSKDTKQEELHEVKLSLDSGTATDEDAEEFIDGNEKKFIDFLKGDNLASAYKYKEQKRKWEHGGLLLEGPKSKIEALREELYKFATYVSPYESHRPFRVAGKEAFEKTL